MQFLAINLLYLSNGARYPVRPRLLLITNRKSYTGFRLALNSVTLDDLDRQNRGFNGFFCFRPGQVYIIHKAVPRYWCWWHGVVVNAFQLKRSYSMPGPVSTAMGDCLWAGKPSQLKPASSVSYTHLTLPTKRIV